MNIYIVRYSPLNIYGDILKDFKTARILSESKDIDYIKLEFEKRCDLANCKITNYKGMFVEVKTLDDYLDNLPSDVI